MARREQGALEEEVKSISNEAVNFRFLRQVFSIVKAGFIRHIHLLQAATANGE